MKIISSYGMLKIVDHNGSYILLFGKGKWQSFPSL